ncbi:MAG: S-adenosylmethionine:tRNA ribosyltransferase-isomerase [Candidatus Atribacteria bacterium]|nr:S-adenosylmethionine:tRNA ribosyltransferase-isomerase [Candidatus Atribacteria bacterium]
MILVDDFDFELPPGLIAQEPVYPRDSARLLLVDRQTKKWEHSFFREISHHLYPGDVLVLNDTKVLPARFFGLKASSGGKVEILFLRKVGGNWECLLKPSRRVRPGQKIVLREDSAFSWIVEKRMGDTWLVRPLFSHEEELFSRFGQVPTPPYVKNPHIQLADYQTVFAHFPGSVAAPTAGLHFTPRLLEELKQKKVRLAWVTLHVGLGTFQPVKSSQLEEHRLHQETYFLPDSTARLIMEAKQEGKRVIAVGTTVVRVLETVYLSFGTLKQAEGETELFIYPGFEFKVVDALVTNFHLPRSTLFMLVCAFAGTSFMKEVYREAINKKYRFFSFGDAMFIR